MHFLPKIHACLDSASKMVANSAICHNQLFIFLASSNSPARQEKNSCMKEFPDTQNEGSVLPIVEEERKEL